LIPQVFLCNRCKLQLSAYAVTLTVSTAEPFKMPFLFPSQHTLHNAFHQLVPFGRHEAPAPLPSPKRTPFQARTELFPTWSVVDDAKNKANALSAEATKEFEKASAKAQAKAGAIELYSAKYYAACTFGGLLACVSATQSLS
jgi:solute carrier family 25 phosphate transporter 3